MAPVLQHKKLDEALLVDQLNHILLSVNLPISLISPTDLTPSLLIAILECILDMHITLVDRNKESKNSRHSKIQNMKIFLGVLETDILDSEVDLSEIDPRRLADGEWDEVFYIGELLCWIGRKMGLVDTEGRANPSASSSSKVLLNASPLQSSSRPRSPKSQLDLDAESLFQGGSTITGSTRRSLGIVSPFPKVVGESDTSVFTAHDDEESDEEHEYSDGVSDILGGLSPFKRPEPIAARCIHEVTSPLDSLLFSTGPAPSTPRQGVNQGPHNPPSLASNSTHDIDAPLERNFLGNSDSISNLSYPSVRYSGFIEPVDEDFELESFEHSRSINLSQDSVTVKVVSFLNILYQITDWPVSNHRSNRPPR